MRRTFPPELLRVEHRANSEQFTTMYRNAWRKGEELVEPNRYFDSRWYALHNSDWSFSVTPFDHYLRTGLIEGRDPSAFVSFAELRRHRRAGSNRQLYARLVTTGAGPSDGVYASSEVLRSVQEQILARITPLVLRPLTQPKRKNLVFIQNSASTRIREWTRDHTRSFDVAANHYDTNELASSIDADIRVFQVGTKSTGVARLVETHRDFFAGYRFIMLLDDDIRLTATQIEAAFGECESLDASLAQPALTADSECAWPDLYEDSFDDRAVRTNTVEVMMPVFSGTFFNHVRDTFRLSVSGFGLDLLWGERLGPGETAWRLGTVTAHHERPVDRADGAYYRFLRENHINPRAELWSLITDYGLRRSITRWPSS